jgi:hypothetical protein
VDKVPDWPGVFVSSSCFDLIDLRAELEVFLRNLGVIPLLSDRPSSEFEVGGYGNSIETCLANVRKSATFLCILSQRYGPRLGKVGFEDISATHLEYRTARSAGRAIYMYVRDRLDADFSVWRANGASTSLQLPWVRKAQDFGLFELIEEHSALIETSPTSNWKWTFRDSVELKQRISFDLRRQSARAILKRLVEAGQLPVLTLRFGSGFTSGVGEYGIKLRVRNLGSTPALDLALEAEGSGSYNFETLATGEATPETAIKLGKVPPAATMKKVFLRYGTSIGLTVQDEITVICSENSTCHVSGTVKRLLDAPAMIIE